MSHIYFIMPVGSDPQYELKREQLTQLSNDAGREFFLPLERHNSFSISEARTDLLNASLVVADLSLERPSCYFELGIAQALGVPVCVIAAVDTILHQTGSLIIPLFYSNLFQYREVVRKCIASAG